MKFAGSRLGPYEIHSSIGAGGMGEARAISALDHPHICTLFDVGHEDGVDFSS